MTLTELTNAMYQRIFNPTPEQLAARRELVARYNAAHPESPIILDEVPR